MSKNPTTSNDYSNFGHSQSTSAAPTRQTPSDDIRYYIDGFLLKQRSQRHSPHTIRFYRWNLQRFVWFLEHEGYPTALREITPNHIRHFFIYLSEQNERRWDSDRWSANKPLSPAGIHAFARAVRAFFRWSSKEARLPYNPFANVDMPPLPNAWKVETYTDEEIAGLLAACDKMAHPFTIQRNRAMLAILLDSGIRASELLGLNVDDINPHEGLFNVTGKGNKVRSVVVGSFARRELWTYLAQYRLHMDTSSSALFVTGKGTALTYYGLKEMFRKLKRLSGISRVSVRAHMCRHTAATVMHRNGMRGSTLQEVLGHTKFDTTRRYYLDISKEDLAAEHALYGPLDRMSHQLRKGYGQSATTDSPLNDTGQSVRELAPANVLLREVAQTSFRAVARKYGVSDTTIRNRIKKAGLLK